MIRHSPSKSHTENAFFFSCCQMRRQKSIRLISGLENKGVGVFSDSNWNLTENVQYLKKKVTITFAQ